MKIKRKKPVYKPKPIDDKNMDRGLEELFTKQKRERESPRQQVPQQVQQQQTPQQQPYQQKMNIPNPLGGGDRSFNPPNPLGKESTHLKGNMDVVSQRPAPMKFNAPNEWGVKPLNIPRGQPQFGQPQPQQQQQPRPTHQTKLEDFGMQMQQPQPQQPEPEPEDEEPYWSGEEWEAWAYQMAVSYPDVQQFLPEWFMQALQEEG